jgi:hypothetical protein
MAKNETIIDQKALVTLPAEILDHIFSFLQKDRPTLKSCSVAGPLLSSFAKRHLFAHIDIYLGIYASQSSPNDGFLVPKLYKCLSERPYLANRIRGISLIADGLSDSYYASSTSLQELLTILSLIQRAEEVSLRNVRWSKLPETFREALLDYLRTSHVKEITLESAYGFPLGFLDDAENIKTLKLETSHCRKLQRAAHPTPTSLESLFLVDVGHWNEFFAWADPGLQNLISLHVKSRILPFPNLYRIFTICLESLRSLTLDIGDSCTFLDLICVKRLIHNYIP